ncbi:MAG: thioredoxin family protein [Nitrospiraceae bacterium]
MKIGDPALDFELPAVDGRTYSLASWADKSVLILVFSCNHCPYVHAYEDRLIAIQRDYGPRSVQLVAINANDATRYPDDNFAAMRRRAEEKAFNFPYLRDESQAVARAYDAAFTPELFVFDRERRLVYTGKIDDNWQAPAAVKRHFLRDAIESVLAGHRPAEPTTHAIGCTIKWRESE